MCVVGVILLAPVWVDPAIVRDILGIGASPTPSAVPQQSDAFVTATNAPDIRGSDVARDDFSREVPSGFGTATVGGNYTQLGGGTTWVTGGSATMSVAQSAAGAAILGDLSLKSVDELATVSLSSGAPSARVGLAMRANGDSMYVVLVGFIGGVANVTVDSVVQGTWTTIAGPIELTDVDVTQPIRVRADSEGFDPTAIRVRAWNAAASEPGQWSINIVDWAGHMQRAGAIGLAWAISDDRRAVVLIDDYAAQSPD